MGIRIQRLTAVKGRIKEHPSAYLLWFDTNRIFSVYHTFIQGAKERRFLIGFDLLFHFKASADRKLTVVVKYGFIFKESSANGRCNTFEFMCSLYMYALILPALIFSSGFETQDMTK